ncbi:MAG: thioesterase family protein [Actinomycetales bacterium]
MSSQFDTATAVTREAPGRYVANVDAGWSIGGRPNGGYLMAMVARAACLEVSPPSDGGADRDASAPPDPLAVSASFPASPSPGEVRLDLDIVRRGRAVSTVHARMTQDGATQVDALVTCGRLPDASTTRYDGTTRPLLPPIGECFELPTEGPGFEVLLMKVVRQQLDPAVLGWTRGEPTGQPEVRGYVSLADGREPDPLSLVLVVDAAPPPTFALGIRGWIPTLQLSAWVRGRPAPGPLVVRSRPSLVVTADDGTGFTDETCEIWDSTGALVAHGTQLAGLRHA